MTRPFDLKYSFTFMFSLYLVSTKSNLAHVSPGAKNAAHDAYRSLILVACLHQYNIPYSEHIKHKEQIAGKAHHSHVVFISLVYQQSLCAFG